VGLEPGISVYAGHLANYVVVPQGASQNPTAAVVAVVVAPHQPLPLPEAKSVC